MPCLFVLLAMILPRVAIVFIWLLTDWFSRAYQTVLWPVLGFFFMPYTTLVYLWARLSAGGVIGLWWLLLVLAILFDVSHWSGAARRRMLA